MVGINTTMIAGADSPFGGVKAERDGKEDGPKASRLCLVTKAYHQA